MSAAMEATGDKSRKPDLKLADLKVVEQEAPAVEPVAPTHQPPRSTKKIILGAVLLAALAAAGWWGHDYWTVGRFQISTDDAYVGADNAAIAPRLAAHVTAVAVEANQRVSKGDVLVRLDDGDYRAALDSALAKRDTQTATLQRIRAQIGAADAGIAQAQAAKQAAEADRVRADAALERASQLLNNAITSRAAYDAAKADRDRTHAQAASAEAGIANAQAQRALVDAQLKEAGQVAAELDVAIAKARRDLAFAVITAPIDGVVAARNVQVGDYVAPGKRLMSLVPLRDIFIDANFKETQLRKLAPGAPVKITVDAYPDRVFEGRITGFAAGTGSTFSLLPADNATGNFTKIVQRVPVRIAIAQPDGQDVLRPGMSVTVTADSRSAGANKP